MLLNEILQKPIANLKQGKKPRDLGQFHSDYSDKPFQDTKNLKTIRSGVSAKAFEHIPSNTVVKYMLAEAGERSGNYQFLRLTLNQQNNPYFPKIYKVKSYKDGLSDTIQFMIVMEKLARMGMEDAKRFAKELNIPLNSKDTNYSLVSDVFTDIQDVFEDDDKRKQLIRRLPPSSLKNALRLIEPLFMKFGPDFHGGNILVRPNGQFVIIDPVLG